MAKNKVTLTLEISDDGSLKLVSKNADKTAKSINKVSKATDKAAKSQDNYNKGAKGVAGATSNGTKAFSKMSQSMGGSSGIVAAYATLAANIFAITAAFGALKNAAALEQLEAGLIRVGNVAGQNLPFIAEGLRGITGAAISTEEAMTAVALGTSAGFDSTQLEGLTRVAKGASLALGRDMADAMSRLTRGAAKLEPEILDELGIMVRLDTATAEYAVTLNKTGAELTQFERRMAFTNSIIEQGEKKFGDIADSIDASPYDQLSATFADLTKSILNFTNIGLKPLAKFFSGNMGALLGIMTLFVGTIVKQMLPAMFDMAKASATAAGTMSLQSKETLKLMLAKNGLSKSTKAALTSALAGEKVEKSLNKVLNNRTASLRLNEGQLKGLTKARVLDGAAITRKQALVAASLVQQRIIIREIRANTLALIQKDRAEVFSLISQGKLIAAGQLYIKVLKDTVKAEILAASALKNGTAVVNVARTAFSLLTFTVKGLGAALLSFIPIIGTVLLVGSMIWPLVRDMFGKKGEVAERVDEVIESFDSFSGIAEQLSTSLAGTEDDVQKYVFGLQASVGILEQVKAGINTVQNTSNSKLRTELMELRLEIEKWEEQAKTGLINNEEWWKSLSGIWATMRGIDTETAKILGEQKVAEAAQTEIELLSKMDQMTKSTAEALVKGAISRITALPSLTKAMGPQIEELRTTLKKIQALEDGGFLNGKELEKEIEGINRVFKEGLISINAATGASNKLSKAIQKFGNKSKGPLDDVLKGLQGIASERKKAQELDDADKTGKSRAVEAFNKGLDRQLKATIKAAGGLTALTSNVEAYQEALVITATDIKKQENIVKSLSGLVKALPSAAEAYIEAQDKIVQLKFDQLDKEREVAIALQDEVIQKATLLKIASQEAAVEKTILSGAERSLIVGKAELAQDKSLLGLQNKIIAGNKKELDHELSRLRLAKELEILADPTKRDKELTEADEAAISKDMFKARESAIIAENTLKLEGVKLEFKLLDLKFKFLEAQAIQTETPLDPKFMESYRGLMIEAKESAISGIISANSTALANLDASIPKDEREVSDFRIEQSDTGDTAFDRTSFTDKKKGGAGFDDIIGSTDKLQAMHNVISPIKDSLAELGPEGELVSSVAQGAFAMADSWSMVGDVFENTGTSMEKAGAIAQAIGSTFSQMGSIMASSSEAEVAGVDDAISAEKKRDGKSKESLAKIKALEQKKEKMARKAFETNKKMQMGAAVANTAAAVIGALGSQPFGVWNIALAAIIGAMGAAQLAVISGSSYNGGGSSSAGGVTSVSMGERSNSVNLATANNQSGEQAYMRGERGIGSGMTNFTPAFTGVKHRASGGATTGFMVGEQGPELFIPETPGVIKPADESGAGSQTPMNVNFSISAVDATGVEELLNVQKGNIIKMIRTAANQHGEFFLETVQTDSLT